MSRVFQISCPFFVFSLHISLPIINYFIPKHDSQIISDTLNVLSSLGETSCWSRVSWAWSVHIFSSHLIHLLLSSLGETSCWSNPCSISIPQGVIMLWKNLKLFAVFYSLGNITALMRYVFPDWFKVPTCCILSSFFLQYMLSYGAMQAAEKHV